jgi:hypothetical protein
MKVAAGDDSGEFSRKTRSISITFQYCFVCVALFSGLRNLGVLKHDDDEIYIIHLSCTNKWNHMIASKLIAKIATLSVLFHSVNRNPWQVSMIPSFLVVSAQKLFPPPAVERWSRSFSNVSRVLWGNFAQCWHKWIDVMFTAVWYTKSNLVGK